MARRSRNNRGFVDLDGILLLDKPYELSSNKALQAARSIFKASKAGHTGSLDPLATGMLPVCFGQTTRFSSYLLDASKKYRAQLELGVVTTTGDREGDIVSQQPVQVNEKQIDQVLQEFVGSSQQIPPMHSAVKHQGERLYTLARKGLEVEREPRDIEIYSLTRIEFDSPLLTLDVHCSKGTYVRTLAEDIGEWLGCGAHLSGLRRTAVAPFFDQKTWTLDELRTLRDEAPDQLKQCLLESDSALHDWPAIELSADLGFYLRQGQPVQVSRAPQDGLVRIYDQHRGFLGLGEILADGRVAPKRLLNTAQGSAP